MTTWDQFLLLWRVMGTAAALEGMGMDVHVRNMILGLHWRVGSLEGRVSNSLFGLL